MSACAFISAFTPRGLTPSIRPPSLSPVSHPQPYLLRRFRVSANAETEKSANDAKPANDDKSPPDAAYAAPSFEAPSFDTDVFSNFVDKAQAKVDDLQKKVQDVDPDEFIAGSKETAMGLVDNALAGDWLNRGELYGAIQIVFVLLLLRGQGALDGLISFFGGPLILFLGAGVSAKALWDLGRKQLSIWPAPVPDGELKCEGVYQYVRHPMYSGLILASAGFAVSTGSPARLALTVAFAAFLAKKINVEEEFLNDCYPGYEDYCDKVKSKLFPGIY